MLNAPHSTPVFGHDHVALTVRDLDASREFYEYLGGRVVSRPSPGFLEIVLGEIRLHLLPEADPVTGEPTRGPRIDHLCLRVSSLDALALVEERINGHPRLRDRAPCVIEDSPPLGEGGKQHVEEFPPRKTLYFEDPDGIRLEVRAYS